MHHNMILQAMAQVVSSSGSFKVKRKKELYFLLLLEVLAELGKLVAVNA